MFDQEPTPIVPAAPAEPSNPPAATEGATANTATPAAFDVDAFNQSLKQFGLDWSVDTLPARLTEHRKKFSEQGQQLGEYKRKYTELEPFAKEMQNPQFNAYISEAVRNFYQGQAVEPTMQGYSPQYAAPLQPFDPVVQRVTQLENQIRASQFTSELNSLSTEGFPLDEPMADAIMAKSAEPGWERASARDLYMVMYGTNVIQLREQAAAKAAVEALQKNNASYTPGPSHSAPAQSAAARPDFSKMSHEQFSEWAVQNNERVLAGFNKR